MFRKPELPPCDEATRMAAEYLIPHVEPATVADARHALIVAGESATIWDWARLFRARILADAIIRHRENPGGKIAAHAPEPSGGYNSVGEIDLSRVIGINPRVYAEIVETRFR